VLFVVGSRSFELVELVLDGASLLVKGGEFLLEFGEAGFGFVDEMGGGLERSDRRKGREVRKAGKFDATEEELKRTSISCCLSSFSALLSTANLAVSASICFW